MDHSSCAVSSRAVAAFPHQYAASRRFELGVPRRFTVSPDGRRVLFTRTRGGLDARSALWLYEDGRERVLAEPASDDAALPQAERDRRERARERAEGIVASATDRDVRLAVYAVGGRVWAVRTDGGTPFAVPGTERAVDPRPSPDGRYVAYVTGGTLRVVSLTGEERVSVVPEGPEVTYGLPEHTAAESMGRDRGHWWAPDGSALLVARVDPTRVPLWYVSDPAHPQRPPRSVRCPTAGTANAEVRLFLVGLDGSRTEVAWDRAGFEYLTAADWDAHGPLLAVQSRDQRRLRVLAADPATGRTRLLRERRDSAWVELVPGTPARTACGALVEPLDDGDVRQLTVGGEVVSPPGLQVHEVLGVTGERVLFSVWENTFERHVWQYEPGRGARRLSGGPGVHTAVAGGDTVVLSGQTPDGWSVTVVTDGQQAGVIRSLAAEPVVVPRPEFLTLGERGLPAMLFLPSWHTPGSRKLPVLLRPYAGPGLRVAVRGRGWPACVAQWCAEQGFAVLVADGRGTPGMGPRWEKAVRGDPLTPVLRDQIDALRAAAAHCPDLDTDRVGISGWSFGGTVAAAAVLRHPEVFHAAVSGAAVTDMPLYDAYWRERFLGHPEEEPENYARSSTLRDAHLLRRPLLLVHGMADDNVLVAHTLRLSAALLAAGRPHRVLPVSGATHSPVGDAGSLLRFETDFLRETLKP
ncbi:prolyl oligopeptidase family serine peptidase [Streptomyces gamaensis]|uniref:Prolyl oligopeptidase family serine peptidase n=1 Tax=Streptomyces gamaensis TaxID=1763542 RepID=A0ABW0Z7R7_9ACTN